ncbi:MAG: hypothetical protein AMXMBFR33_32560 [Candidatus Xenobia bacterium]
MPHRPEARSPPAACLLRLCTDLGLTPSNFIATLSWLEHASWEMLTLAFVECLNQRMSGSRRGDPELSKPHQLEPLEDPA